MKNKNGKGNRTSELYSLACSEVKAPDELLEKVIGMEKVSTVKVSSFKRVAVALLALAVMAFGSNAIVYAATGTGWIGRIMVSVFGEDKEVNFTEDTDPNGDKCYVGNVKAENGDTLSIVTYDMDNLKGKQFNVDDAGISVTDEAGNETHIDTCDQFEEFSVGIVKVTPLPEK